MASVTLPPESRLAGGEPAFGSDMVLFRTAILGLANQLGIGGSGIDGALTDVNWTRWRQPTTLSLTSTHTCKHLTTLVATTSITISGTLTVPTSGNMTLEHMADTTWTPGGAFGTYRLSASGGDYYYGMPLPGWMQAGDATGVSDGGGGGSFGGGGRGEGSGSDSGGRGWGNNAAAANVFANTELWKNFRHLRGGFGASGAGDLRQSGLGYPGGCLIILCEGKVTISGTINCNGGDGGNETLDNGGGGGGSVIIISSEEIDGTGGTINCNGGDAYFGLSGEAGGGGGGGYIALVAPTITAPTMSVDGGNNRQGTAPYIGRAGDTATVTTAVTDEVRSAIIASGLLGSSATNFAAKLGLDA